MRGVRGTNSKSAMVVNRHTVLTVQVAISQEGPWFADICVLD